MVAPLTAELETGLAQPGQIEFGAGGIIPSTAQPTLAQNLAPKLLAHVYDTHYNFKQMLTVLDYPSIKWTLNAAGHPLNLSFQDNSSNPSVVPGNLVRLTYSGDTFVMYTGFVEDVQDDYSDAAKHTLVVSPLGNELGDSYFSKAYTVPTDVTLMVQDAVAATNHLFVTPISCPMSGALAIYDFKHTTALDVLKVAAQVAGVNWFWYVDPKGQVWFQNYNSGITPTFTVKQGTDFVARKYTSPIGKLKNKVVAVGAIPSGGSAPITSTYSGASVNQYGLKALMPPLNFPTVTDQATLDAITNTVGVGLDRRITRVTLTVANFGTRIHMGQANPTLRYFEPNAQPLAETYTGSGGYSPNYVVLEVDNNGPVQTVTVGDVPTTADDYKWFEADVIRRTSISDVTYSPMALNVVGQVTAGGGVQTGPGGVGNARWIIDHDSIRCEDGSGSDYGAGQNVVFRAGSDGKLFLGAGLTIQTASGGPVMKMIGSTPIFLINAGKGFDNVQLGNLSAYTDAGGLTSPAGYGIRILDDSNNLLLDQTGATIIKQLGEGPVTGGSALTAGAGQVIPGTEFTVNVRSSQSRAVLFHIGFLSASFTAGTGICSVYCQVVRLSDGAQTTGTSQVIDAGIAGLQNASPHLTSINTVAGKYKFHMLADVPAAATVTFNRGNSHAFQLAQ